MSASIDAGSGAGFRALDEGVGLGVPVVGALVTGGVAVLLPAYAVGPGPVVPPPRSSVGPTAVQAPSRTAAVRLATVARAVCTTRVSPGNAGIPSLLPASWPIRDAHPPTDDRWWAQPSDTPARHAWGARNGIPAVVGRFRRVRRPPRGRSRPAAAATARAAAAGPSHRARAGRPKGPCAPRRSGSRVRATSTPPCRGRAAARWPAPDRRVPSPRPLRLRGDARGCR